MTDLELKRRVEDELNWEPSVNASEIGASIKNGVITLAGNIPGYWEKFAAERAAARVAGLKAVGYIGATRPRWGERKHE